MKTTWRVIGSCLLFASAVMMTNLGLARHGIPKSVTIAAGSSKVELVKSATISLPQGYSASDHLTMQLITIRPTGFDPASITRGPGRFLLAVDNKSGLSVVSLRIAAEGGNRVHEIQLSRAQHRSREKITLPSGNYLLTEAAHPDWICRITITS